MPRIKFHQVAALVVFVATAAWVATGEFSSVGSAANENPAEQPKAEAETPKVSLRTVAVIDPRRIEHSRAIRLSGTTEADKRTVLTTRAGGIIAELPVKLGSTVKTGQDVRAGWPAREIRLYGPGTDSGTFDYFTGRNLVSQTGIKKLDARHERSG